METIHPGFIQDSVAETLLITVAFRALDAQEKRPILGDLKSLELVQKINYPFEKFAKGTLMSRLGTNVRVKYFDECAKAFIESHQKPVVVFLGCGLDTRYERLGRDTRAVFYELDLPEVMDSRAKLLPETENDRFLASSLFEKEWMEEIQNAHPDGEFLFIIEGVLMYFEKEKVREFLCQLSEAFPGAELCFDALSVWCSKNSNRHDVMKNMRARFCWGMDDDQELCTWRAGLRVLSDTSIMWKMGDFHWIPRILRHIPRFRHASRMLRVQLG